MKPMTKALQNNFYFSSLHQLHKITITTVIMKTTPSYIFQQSELRFAKGIMNISTTLKKFLKKRSKVAIHLKKGIKEAWNLLFTPKKKLTKKKDEGLFSALTGTFQDENIWIIDIGESRHMIEHHKQLIFFSKGKSCYSVELGE